MFNHKATEAREINWLSQVDTNSKNHTRSTQPSSTMSLCYCTLDLSLLSLLNVLIIVQILSRNLTCHVVKNKKPLQEDRSLWYERSVFKSSFRELKVCSYIWFCVEWCLILNFRCSCFSSADCGWCSIRQRFVKYYP